MLRFAIFSFLLIITLFRRLIVTRKLIMDLGLSAYQ